MTAFAFFRFPGVCAAGEVKEGDNRLSEESPGLPTGMGPAHELRTDYRDPDFPRLPLSDGAQNQRGVLPPKTERIFEGHPDFRRPR